MSEVAQLEAEYEKAQADYLEKRDGGKSETVVKNARTKFSEVQQRLADARRAERIAQGRGTGVTVAVQNDTEA